MSPILKSCVIILYFTTRVCTTMSNPINNANDGDTPLIVAVRNNDLGTVNSLVLAGADHRPRNNAGESALSLALASGHDELRNLVTAHVLTTCIMGLVPPPAASREPSPEPSFSPPPQPSASPEASPVSDDSSFWAMSPHTALSDTSPKSSPKSSPEASSEASSEASPELSPDSDDWKFRFVETFVLNKRQRLAPPDSP